MKSKKSLSLTNQQICRFESENNLFIYELQKYAILIYKKKRKKKEYIILGGE